MRLVPEFVSQGLPFAALIAIRNPDDRPTEVTVPLSLSIPRTIRISVEPPGGKEAMPAYLAKSPCDTKVITRPIPPRAALIAKKWIAYTPKGSLFQEPGEYTIRVSILLGSGWRELAPRRVQVNPPRRSAALAHQDFQRLPPVPLGLLLRDNVGSYPDREETIERFWSIATYYPDTPYGKYAMFFLAKEEMDQALSTATRGKPLTCRQEGELRRAIEPLLRLESLGPPENLVAEVEFDLACAFIRLGKMDEATRRLEALAGRELPSGRARTVARLLEKAASGPEESSEE